MIPFALIFHFITSIQNVDLNQRTDPKVVRIDALKMDYSLKQFSVKATSEVEIHFTNKDIVKHNLLILQPGTLEKVGALADELATSPDGVKSEWVPDIPEVLFLTPLLKRDDKYILKFTAPTKKGAYPFVCTYPTHWRMMNGTMIVE